MRRVDSERSRTFGAKGFKSADETARGPRVLPKGLEALGALALDLRWTWSHAGDDLWNTLDAETWEATGNPWAILNIISDEQLKKAVADRTFGQRLRELDEERRAYLEQPGWFASSPANGVLKRVAYFSMEFALGEGLPLYAGGLGVLAGDYLKTASDLGVPVSGIGLLYREGYFRQVLDDAGIQSEAYPDNDPADLPVTPLRDLRGPWLRVAVELPGRKLLLRVWRAFVGRTSLYLLDSNDPLNAPRDRAITAKLYPSDPEQRLLQEIVLGVGGWRALIAANIAVDVCHLNEGHAAFAVLERIRSFMKNMGCSFQEALWATRVGNVFTSHTPVSAGFDTFAPSLVGRFLKDYAAEFGVRLEDLVALGKPNPSDANEVFNMAFLAARGSGFINGVSALHGQLTRRILQPLFPRWPEREVPADHITNGVHAPSWDSRWADEVWTGCCGKHRWLTTSQDLCDALCNASDTNLWSMRTHARAALVAYARERLVRQLGERGADPDAITTARTALDPGVLTLGFARRFTEYKRPTLLLRDPARLKRIVTNTSRPVQLVVAGKAHPADQRGKELVREFVAFAQDPEVRARVVFLEDYDIALAQQLTEGVDVWINTPRRPWEACGTSGMKVLVSGGLNLSELDGWWAEAYEPGLGWAIGDGAEHEDSQWDAYEAGQLYELLENQIVPEFYERDAEGLPRNWLARIRASMSQLAPRFSGNRMIIEYLEKAYLPAAAALATRGAESAKVARELSAWESKLRRDWSQIYFGALNVTDEGSSQRRFRVELFLGENDPSALEVQLYADRVAELPAVAVPMLPVAISDRREPRIFEALVTSERPAEHFTPRVVPRHPAARVPLEEAQILWFR
ncbi:MAG TPA: alpha-glucan family phosphorylase [Xanthobacteraceae bacterium]|nr:alpha-glucan family phosphorylase [Xanthobacteraceae bacterium]